MVATRQEGPPLLKQINDKVSYLFWVKKEFDLKALFRFGSICKRNE
jgi:hypothetical protein